MGNDSLLNGLLGVIKQPVFAKDQNLIYTFCNQAFADYMGLTREEIIGSNVFQLFDPEQAEIYHQSDVDLLREGGYQAHEATIRSKTGENYTVIFHKNVIQDQNGNINGIVCRVENVTTLKEREKELIEKESNYKKIFENVQDIFYQVDLNGKILEISPSVSKYSDYTQQEIIGQSINQFYANPEERDLLLSQLKEKGEVMDFEVQLRGNQNQLSNASVNAHLMFDEKGLVCGVEGTLRDITERKQTEEKLKLSLSVLQATLDSTTDGILVVSTSGKITSYNNQFKTLFGIPDGIMETGNDAAAIDSVLNKLKHPDRFIDKINHLYQHPEMESFDTIDFIDGRILDRHSCPQLLDGKPIGRVWNFRDVTVRKNEELELKESEERYRQFFES